MLDRNEHETPRTLSLSEIVQRITMMLGQPWHIDQIELAQIGEEKEISEFFIALQHLSGTANMTITRCRHKKEDIVIFSPTGASSAGSSQNLTESLLKAYEASRIKRPVWLNFNLVMDIVHGIAECPTELSFRDKVWNGGFQCIPTTERDEIWLQNQKTLYTQFLTGLQEEFSTTVEEHTVILAYVLRNTAYTLKMDLETTQGFDDLMRLISLSSITLNNLFQLYAKAVSFLKEVA